MDSNTINWIAMAVLSALLLAFGMPVLLEVMRGGHGGDHHAKAAYALPEPDKTGAGGAAPEAKKGFEFASVASLLSDASADAGKSVFKKCAACHTVNDGGKNGQGPNLWEIVGRARAGVEGFKYSKAMQEKAGEWDYQSLAEFLHKPNAWLKGTKMRFVGVKSDKDLANMLAYLQSLSAAPKPFPAAQ